MKALAVMALSLTFAFASVFDATAKSRRGGFLGALIGNGLAGLSKGGSARPAEKDYNERTLRPPELRSCLIAAHKLDEQGAELDSEAEKLDLETAAIRTVKSELERDSNVSARGQFEIDHFNGRIDNFNKRLRANGYDVEIYNGKANVHSNRVKDFNRNCADRRFFVYDLDAIKTDLPFTISQYIRQ